MANVSANSMACHPRATCHIVGCCHLANSVSWSRSYMSHCRVLPPGEFNGMSSQSHVGLSHCIVLPLGEFTLMIPEPHATLQGAVTWWNLCRDCATTTTAILKSFFAIFYFILFFNAVSALTSGGFRIVSDIIVKDRRDRQTDRRTDILRRHSLRYAYASRGKHWRFSTLFRKWYQMRPWCIGTRTRSIEWYQFQWPCDA